MASHTRRVVVYFGNEVYQVDVEFDPLDPPSEDVLIDRAREQVINQHAPAASFRKGSILD